MQSPTLNNPDPLAPRVAVVTIGKAPIPGDSPVKSLAFEPHLAKISDRIRNPLFVAINGKWADRQQHGRLAYDAMLQHGAVSGPAGALLSYLKSYKPLFKPRTSSPTDRQKQFADFANSQLERLGSTGDPRQGWSKVIEWFYQGLVYGFTLAEMETAVESWHGKPRIQIQRIFPMAQASLDVGFVPREEFGETVLSNIDPRYRCFELSDNGTITDIHQFWYSTGISSDERRTTWSGPELLSILHFAHGGGEGNPFGQSILWSAYKHWADLYTIECMETAFLDTSLPYLTASYKTPDGRPSPAAHAMYMETIGQQDPSKRFLAAPDTDFGSVAPSNPNFTDHVFKRKDELRKYITHAIGVPSSVYSEGNGQEANTRELVSVFFGNLLPALLSEISDVMTWQFSKRLIDSNWTNVQNEDYPVLTFRMILNEDLRVAMPLLQQSINLVDSDRLGEFLQTFVPGFDREFIPKDHKNSVAEMRMPSGAGGQSQPPRKEPGSPDRITTGETGNPSNDKTAA